MSIDNRNGRTLWDCVYDDPLIWGSVFLAMIMIIGQIVFQVAKLFAPLQSQ